MLMMKRRGAVVATALVLSFAAALAGSGAKAQDAASAASASSLPPEAAASLPPEAAKGRYLATVGNCETCHTGEGGAPFAGGVKFVTAFGVLYSTNITQDPETGIGAWSLEDFKNSMRKGVRPDGQHLYPAFPYPSFAKASDEDIAALYAYLKTIAPVKAENKPNEMKFPYNIRALMGIWNALFHKAAAYQPDDNQSTEWNRGAYLVEGLGHCGACHTPRNFLGAEQSDLALAGGVYMDKTANGEYRKWAAVNLTPAKTGLGAWSADDIAEYLKTGINPRATVYGPMNEVVINSTSRLDEADLKAMAVYLKGLPEKAQNPGKAPSEEVMRAGAAAYTVRCGTCHLPTGLGAPMGVEPLGVPLAGSAVVQAPDPASLINTIIYGPQLPPYPFASPRRMMEPWGDKMSDEEIANVASYVRASWGNEAGLVTPEDVAKQR